MECHEIFEYNNENYVQKLVALVALCPACHEVKHIGLAQVEGRGEEAHAHLCKINGWSNEQGDRYSAEQFDIWEERSRHSWSLDLSFLKEYFGIEFKEDAAREALGVEEAAYNEDERKPGIRFRGIRGVLSYIKQLFSRPRLR